MLISSRKYAALHILAANMLRSRTTAKFSKWVRVAESSTSSLRIHSEWEPPWTNWRWDGAVTLIKWALKISRIYVSETIILTFGHEASLEQWKPPILVFGKLTVFLRGNLKFGGTFSRRDELWIHYLIRTRYESTSPVPNQCDKHNQLHTSQ